jgi:hypothetical protein
MDNEIKTSDNSGGSIRLIGNMILIAGIVVVLISQFMATSVAPDYANIDIETAQYLPEKVVNFELIANKINFLILGGLLIIIGLKLSLISNKTISDIKQQSKSIEPVPTENIKEDFADLKDLEE